MAYIMNDVKLDFKDVLITPQKSDLSSRKDVELNEKIEFKYSKRVFNGIPIIASQMDTIGTFEMAESLSKYGILTVIHRFYTVDQWTQFSQKSRGNLKYVSVNIGMHPSEVQKLIEILNKFEEISFISLDVANGYCTKVLEHVKNIRSLFPNHTIIAGDVATSEGVQELIAAGADIVKVGLGSGSVCTTRIKTGVGYPQLSAVIECSKVAHSQGAHIISDGGCICPGDVVKAFAAGADFVMCGGLFSGHDQCPGDIIEKSGKKFKTFYGLSSSEYMNKHLGGVSKYKTSEGRCVQVPYKGDIKDTVDDILGGIRSACTYVGARTIGALPKNVTFIRCTQQFNTTFA